MKKLFTKYFQGTSIVLLTLLAALVVLTACEEVIDIDTDYIEQKIVIDGAITDSPVGSRVLISRTVNAFKSGGEQKVSGATVIVSDDTGNSESLIESSSGKYSFSSMRAQQGRTYNLKVLYDGKEYTGVSTLNPPMLIFEPFPHGYKLRLFPEVNRLPKRAVTSSAHNEIKGIEVIDDRKSAPGEER